MSESYMSNNVTTFAFNPVFIDQMSHIAARPSNTQPTGRVQDTIDIDSIIDIIDNIDANSEVEVAEERAADPIRSKEDINNIVYSLLTKGKFRDAMILVLGFNFGLRVSDLRRLQFSDVIEGKKVKDMFKLVEKKTSNTRSVKVNRHVYLNNAARKIIILYLKHNKKSLNDYLFVSESNNKGKKVDKYGFVYGNDHVQPLDRRSFDTILKNATKGIEPGRYSTHALRKTFSFHVLMQDSYDVPAAALKPRQLQLLQRIHHHSSEDITIRYAGISEKEIEQAYMHLNLGEGGIDRYIKEFGF